MITLLNNKKEAIGFIDDYILDISITKVVNDFDTLNFEAYSQSEEVLSLKEEDYVKFNKIVYVIKSVDRDRSTIRFSCQLDIEELKATLFEKFTVTEKSAKEVLDVAFRGTGWSVDDSAMKSKNRTVRRLNSNAEELLKITLRTFQCEMIVDNIEKIIYLYDEIGEDKGVYFTDELNLISIECKSDTYDYITNLKAIGKDGLTVGDINGGNDYVVNYQYTNKVIPAIWKDERYINPVSLKEDAEKKLAELSKPKRAYACETMDLANMSKDYDILSYSIGDKVYLMDSVSANSEKHRIIKLIEHPFKPESNRTELANATLTFEDIQSKNNDSNALLESLTTEGGLIDGNMIDGPNVKDIKYSIEFGNLIYNNSNVDTKITFFFAQSYGLAPSFMYQSHNRNLQVSIEPLSNDYGFFGGVATIKNNTGLVIKESIIITAYCALPNGGGA